LSPAGGGLGNVRSSGSRLNEKLGPFSIEIQYLPNGLRPGQEIAVWSRGRGHAEQRLAAMRTERAKSFALADASTESAAEIPQAARSLIDTGKSRLSSYQIVSNKLQSYPSRWNRITSERRLCDHFCSSHAFLHTL
jgi:hypothetical protein